ncbi:MAG: SRPBCC family protein [Deltaproteobacteria bacterium]|nr:SRPBCC family protein [Deltaproteobacteria bacterium]
MIEISLEAHINAPRERVWETLVDHEGMPEWFPAKEVIRRRPGEPDPNGLGTRRVVRMSGLAIEEVVTAFKPCEHFEYSVVEGAPFVDHTADVILMDEGDGTRLRWSTRLRPLIPGTGWIVKSNVTRMLQRAVSGLKRVVEMQAGWPEDETAPHSGSSGPDDDDAPQP